MYKLVNNCNTVFLFLNQIITTIIRMIKTITDITKKKSVPLKTLAEIKGAILINNSFKYRT